MGRLLIATGIVAIGSGVGCGSAGGASESDAGSSDALASPAADDASTASDVGSTPDGTSGVVTGVDAEVDAGPLVAQCQALAMAFAHSCETQLVGGVVTPDTSRACVWTTYAGICQTGRTQLLLDSMMCFGQNPSCWVFSDSNTAGSCLDSVHAAAPTSPALGDFVQRVCAGCSSGGMCSADASAMYVAEINAGRSELLPYVSDAELLQIATCATKTCPDNIAANCGSIPDVAGTLSCK